MVRMWLTNTLSGVPTSISYDWRDDGTNTSDCESNFGSVRNKPTGNAAAPFTPKPAYTAALTAQAGVGNAAAFAGGVKPIAPLPSNAAPKDVFILAFSGYSRPGGAGPPVAFAAWTNATVCPSTPPADADRRDCGYDHITEAACAERKCCWDTSPGSGPQCYNGATAPPAPFSFPVAGAAADACFNVVSMLGDRLADACAKGGVVTVALSDAPTYLL